jgi:hypothetical protein
MMLREEWCVYWSPHYYFVLIGRITTFTNVIELINCFWNNIAVISTLSATTTMAWVLGAITIKQAKKHVEQSPKLYKHCNFVRYIFVVPL